MWRSTVLVVGAGPVGLVAALELAQAGVPVTVLESRSGPTTGPQDMIYRWSTLPILERLGVLPEMLVSGVVTTQWCYRVRHSGEQLVFDLSVLSGEVEHPYNLHLAHDEFSRVLLSHLGRHAHAQVLWSTAVRGVVQDRQGVSVTADTPDGPRELRAGWVVGADGAHSVVRRSLGLGFAGMTWPERLVSLSLPFDFSTLGYLPTTYQLAPQHGALVGQVNRDGMWRYVFGESRLLPEESIRVRVPAALAAVHADVSDVRLADWSAYRVHERAADRLRVGRVLLAGDAGHVTNPTGGFGLAGGLFDAVAVGSALREVLRDSAADHVLDRYAADRSRYFHKVASPLSSDTMHLVFHAGDIARLDEDVEHYRQIVASPARQREYLLLSRELEALPAA